ncbi:MAG: CHC2 zinc finger domain-containing protein [Acidovorax temperans]|uniref:CHC2 zinc finger domain-containing protein n=1 Tax=Acidovorax temperans TaxID=80878 RepID=UPI00391CB8FA
MARIPEADIQRLKEEVAVVRLAEASGLALKKSGKDFVARCPFHADDTASLVITPGKNLWHCFGCGAAGGPIDWVIKTQGVSFRHAVELLRSDPSLAAGSLDSAGGTAGSATGAGQVVKRSTVRRLSAPVALEASEQELLNQVVEYYHQTLLASPEALAYLDKRGLGGLAGQADGEHAHGLVARFRLGFANRTLGLRLPQARVKAGGELRARLQGLGVLRESGHEHFNGCLVVPVFDDAGNVTEIYGRKIGDKVEGPAHLYLPGPHAGVWNAQGLQGQEEVILTEALIDAMTFWCAGYAHVTAAYGVEGFTEDHIATFQRCGVRRVLIAFDRDEAGERGTAKVVQRLTAAGLESLRIQFPKGMDANEYARKVTPAAKSLGLLIRKAIWLAKGPPPTEAPGQRVEDVEDAPAQELQAKSASSAGTTCTSSYQNSSVQPAPSAPSAPSSLAAAVGVAASTEPAGEPPIEHIGDDEILLHFGERRYRIRGLAKNLSHETLKINVLVSRQVAGDPADQAPNQVYYVDAFDLYAARARSAYIVQAARELAVREEVIKHDLGRVLLKLEALQAQRMVAALQVEPAVPAMNDAEQAQALAWLCAPDLLERILADFDAVGLVGEASNKLMGYLAAVSRKLSAPLAVVVQSSSAAGKSSLMDAVLAFMPEEERIQYSAMTGQSLFYMGQTQLKHKILAIAEEEGAARASYALKLLQSEGELTIASTGKDPNTGNLITQQYRVEGPVMIFLTTTAIEIDEELLNRCIVLSVDEGRAQTEAIHARQRAKRTLAGLRARQDKAAVLTLHRNAQRLLRPLAVVNPYADQLTFLSDKTRTRRDHEKYLTLIDTIALLHQHQRPVKTLAGAHGGLDYIEVQPSDIAHANALAHAVLGVSLDELPPVTRRVLGEVVRLVQGRMQTQQLPRADIRFSRKDVREASGMSDTQLRVHLERLVQLEYLLTHRGTRGQSFEYELLYDGDGQQAAHLSGLLEIAPGTPSLEPAPTKPSSRGGAPENAGPTRVQNGPNAGTSPTPETAASPHGIRLGQATPTPDHKTHALQSLHGDAQTPAYLQTPSPATPLAA